MFQAKLYAFGARALARMNQLMLDMLADDGMQPGPRLSEWYLHQFHADLGATLRVSDRAIQTQIGGAYDLV